MKKLGFLFIISLLCFTACNQQEQTKEQEQKDGLLPTDLVNNPRSAENTDSNAFAALPVMNFKDTVYDFGTIKEGELVSGEFEFTNTGKTPLIVSSANASCGCTVADFPREPLAPGKSSVIKVRFNSEGKKGHQEKTVTLTTNSVRGVRTLFMKGEVKE
jgi:hypothetical protein